MERLWTPWRFAYVTDASQPSALPCIFCEALARGAHEPLLIYRGRACFVILNKYPYNNGHLMVVPHRHVARLAEATPEELTELIALTQVAERVLTEAYQPQGFNMGLNLGKPAGAGVLDHVHLHVVPRWNGDTNFMAVVGETRVLPEELTATVRRLQPLFDRLASNF